MSNELTDLLKNYLPGTRNANEIADVNVVQLPLEKLNIDVLKCGGIPRGRTIELYGPPSCGKTTIAINIAQWYIKQGLKVLWDDREGTFPDEAYTSGIGLNRDQLTMMDTGSGNDALYQFEMVAALNYADLYIVDSLAMLHPEGASIVGDTETQSMHDKLARASLLTGFFQRLRSGYRIGNPGTCKKDGTYNKGDLVKSDRMYWKDGKEDHYWHKLTDKDVTLIMINHEKVKPGVRFGSKSSTPGGDSMKFDASVRLKITYKKKSKERVDGLPASKLITVRADKNKVGPPFGEAAFLLMRDGRLIEYGKKVKGIQDDDDFEEVTASDMEA